MDLTDEDDMELWYLQNNYFWEVLKKVFKSDLALEAFVHYGGTQDALATFRKLDHFSRSKNRLSYHLSQRWRLLLKKVYTPSAGSRVSFLTGWFVALELVNKYSSTNSKQSDDLVLSTLDNAFHMDPDMKYAFISLPVATTRRADDIENLKQHLYNCATKADNDDRRLKEAGIQTNWHQFVATQVHQLTAIQPDPYAGELQFFRTSLQKSSNPRLPNHT
mmetsp:Transcript_7590/g.17099  ORF Transcript_7590/g.17099 Transcript_7590/m.17099 type:complete len:219 (-) Transcript_7590:706-1362(-)